MKEIKPFNNFLTPTAIQNLKINGLFEEVEQAAKLYASQFIDKAADLADTTLLNETQVVEEIYKLKSELK